MEQPQIGGLKETRREKGSDQKWKLVSRGGWGEINANLKEWTHARKASIVNDFNYERCF